MHSTTFERRTGRVASLHLLFFTGGLLLCLSLPATTAWSADASADGGGLTAQASAEQGHGKLEPRYQPREPEPEGVHNSSYVFGMTRGVADSTIHPAVKAPIFLLTLPLDLAFLPFALIGGFFG